MKQQSDRIAELEAEVTALRQHTARLETELHTYRTLIEHTPDAIVMTDMNGIVTASNRAFGELFDYGNQVIGMSSMAFFPEEEHEHVNELMQQMLQQELWRGTTRYRRRDGSTFIGDNSTIVMTDEQGTPQGTVTIIRDTSEQIQREQEVQRLVAAIESSSDLIGMANLEGQTIYMNEPGCRMVGLANEEEARQATISDYIYREDRPYLQEVVMPTIAEQGLWQGEIRLQNFSTGEPFPAYVTLFLVKHRETGEPVAIGSVTRDIRAQKQAEAERVALQEQVIAAQKAAIRELSTPLIPIAQGVIAMPLIGTIDSGRAQQVLEALLEGVAAQQAHVAILDITGVQTIDTQIANALIQAARAVRLLGAEVVLTGIRPDVAQTLVHLGVDLSGLTTRGNLQSGIAYAINHEH